MGVDQGGNGPEAVDAGKSLQEGLYDCQIALKPTASMSVKTASDTPKASSERAQRPTDYVAQCRSYLGDVGALVFFCAATLRPEMSTSALASWTRQVQAAQRSLKKRFRLPRVDAKKKAFLPAAPKIDKPQVSVWRKASPFQSPIPTGMGEGWTFRVLSIPVTGPTIEASQSGTPPWSGHLIVVYEGQTGTFFHQFVGLSSNFVVTPDLVAYLLTRIEKLMLQHDSAITYANKARTLYWPQLDEACPASTRAAFSAWEKLCQDNQGNSDLVTFKWMSTRQVWFDFSRWQLNGYPQPSPSYQVQITPETLSEKLNQMIMEGHLNALQPDDEKMAPKRRKHLQNQMDEARHFGNALTRLTNALNRQQTSAAKAAHKEQVKAANESQSTTDQVATTPPPGPFIAPPPWHSITPAKPHERTKVRQFEKKTPYAQPTTITVTRTKLE